MGCPQKQVWLLLSAILWLGNIEFDSAGDDSVTVRRDEALANAAELLNLDEDELATALTERMLTAGMLTISLHRMLYVIDTSMTQGWQSHLDLIGQQLTIFTHWYTEVMALHQAVLQIGQVHWLKRDGAMHWTVKWWLGFHTWSDD